MKFKNLSEATLYFPLKEGETVENGAVYEIVSGEAQKVTEAVTGTLLGVCAGGNNIRDGYIMLDIDPTSVFKETYTDLPTIGAFVDGCKLVIGVDTDAETFAYLVRKEETPETPEETPETPEETPETPEV